jgi:beta-lactamase regulating signal transducer with metallopeptidase domain/DUF4097 and DUF4098 domain-containing protein YvlB
MTIAPMIPDPFFYGQPIHGKSIAGPSIYGSVIPFHFTAAPVLFAKVVSELPQAALRSLVLAIGVWAILRLFRIRNVLALKCAWTLVLAAAFLMPLLLPIASRLPQATLVLPAFMHRTAPASSWPEETLPSQPNLPPTSHQFAVPAISHPHHAGEPAAAPSETGVLPAPEARSPKVTALPTFSVFAAIALVYLTICGVLLFRLVYGLASAWLLWRSARPVSSDLAMTHSLHLRSSTAVTSPVTIGSSVVLPADFRSWDSEKLRIVLAHERSHVRQGDFYLQALAGLYAAIVWFSPLGWWLKRQLSDLAEAVSDCSGLKEAASRASYAQILLEFAAAPHLTQVGVAMARSSNLSHRIERLCNESAFRQAFTASRRTLATALLVPVVLFAAATLVRVAATAQTPQIKSAQSPTPPTAPSSPEAATPASPAAAPTEVAAPEAVPAPAQAPAPSSNAAPARPATPASPAHVEVPPIHINVPAVHVNVPAQHVNISAQHIDVPAVHVDVPAIHIDMPARHIDVPAVHVYVPARHIDIAAKHIDIPATLIDKPAIHIDIHARQIDIPSIHVDMPPSDAPSGSDGHASNGSGGGELLAMLNGFGRSLFGRASVADSGAEATFDRNLTFSGKLDLLVATGSGNITVTRGAANQIHIHGIVKVNHDGDPAQAQQIAANPPIEQQGNTIQIGGRQENLHGISISYVIEAPADTALRAATGSGNITDTGVGQDAKLSTGSGNILATGIDGGFKAQTGSGNIAIDGSGQGDAKAQTGSGTIDLKGVHGSLVAQTGSGEIKAAGTPSSSWKLQTGSGSIELSTGNAPMNLDASTGSGKISTDHSVAAQTTEDRHHLRAQLNGGGPEVRVETGSGSIRVD